MFTSATLTALKLTVPSILGYWHTDPRIFVGAVAFAQWIFPSVIRDVVEQWHDPGTDLVDYCVLGAGFGVFGIAAPSVLRRLRSHTHAVRIFELSLLNAILLPVSGHAYEKMHAMIPERLEHFAIDRWILTTQIMACVVFGLIEGIRVVQQAQERNIAAMHDFLDRRVWVQEHAPVAAIRTLNHTHLASVHRACSESALRLHVAYGRAIADQPTAHDLITPMRQWIVQDTPVFRAYGKPVRVLLEVLAQRDAAQSPYVDPLSGKTVTQLIALIFLAIHDRKRCIGSLEDAGRAFVEEGLFEILDDRLEYICQAGVFNKLVEAMVGILPDCQSGGVSLALAGLKLYRIVVREADAYLQQQRDSLTDFLFVALLAACEAEGVSVIWPTIAQTVEAEFLEEYGAWFAVLYPDQRRALLEQAIYVDIAALLESYAAPLRARAEPHLPIVQFRTVAQQGVGRVLSDPAPGRARSRHRRMHSA